jgi:hypothetical protein
MTMGSEIRVMMRAPIESASRPPICIEAMAAAPAKNNRIAIWRSSSMSLSRSDGSEAP